MFKRIKADGYEKVIAVAISSGLSGTYQTFTSFGPAPEGLETHYIDTRNIGICDESPNGSSNIRGSSSTTASA